MYIVHNISPDMSFTWFPPHICSTASHVVSCDIYFLENFFPIAGLDLDGFVSMGTTISP